MNKKYYILLVVAVCFYCCNTDSEKKSIQSGSFDLENKNTNMSINDFMSWVVDDKNELAKMEQVKDINYKICYMPKETMAYIQLKKENYTQDEFNKTCERYAGMEYFQLRLELTEGLGELIKYQLVSSQQYNERVSYLAFQMQKDIFLVQDNDTLHPGLYHFERVFEAAPYATVMLAFDNKKFKKEEEFMIVYNDRLFNKGYIKYSYKPQQLIDLPTIAGI